MSTFSGTVQKPQKSTNFSGGRSKEIQLEYWKKYSEICDELSEGDFQVIPKPQHWQYIPLGKTGVSLQLTVNTQTDSIGVDLFIANNKTLFEKLEKNKAEIEKELGTLEWINNSNTKSARIRQMQSCAVQDLNPEAITRHIVLAKNFKETLCLTITFEQLHEMGSKIGGKKKPFKRGKHYFKWVIDTSEF